MSRGKVIFLSTCDTCRRIIREAEIPPTFEFHDLKQGHISRDELRSLRKYVSSYDELANKRARKLKEMKPDWKSMSEENLADLILQDYTFLKRPIILHEGNAFIGNSGNVVQALKDYLRNL